jgi:predicted DNA-binding transcriptional regulator YafY
MLHNKGEYYIFSPYSLIWDGDYYYVVGYSEKYKSIGSHRIDRIYQRPEILNEIAYPEPKGFDINRYVNILFHMYDSPRKTVELICSNEIIDAIIDRFGTGVEIFAYDQENFRIIEEVPVGKLFFNWIFGFEGKVRIKAPEDVKAQYQKQLKNAFSLVCID